jgi:hypothetical protein
MKQRAAEHEMVPGGILVTRAILATAAVLLLAAAQTDLSAFDPYQFAWSYIRLLAGF